MYVHKSIRHSCSFTSYCLSPFRWKPDCLKDYAFHLLKLTVARRPKRESRGGWVGKKKKSWWYQSWHFCREETPCFCQGPTAGIPPPPRTGHSAVPPAAPQALPAPRRSRSRPQQPREARAGRGRSPLPSAQHGGSGGGSPGPGAQPRRLPPHAGAQELPGAHGGRRLSPRDPQPSSVSFCPPGAPRKPGGPEGAGARLASSFTPGGAGTAGRRQRRAGGRYGHSPRPGSRREPRPPPSFGRCPGNQRAKECGRRGGREQSVPGTARRSPPRAPLRPRAQLRPRSPAPAAAAPPAAAPPRGAAPGAGCPCLGSPRRAVLSLLSPLPLSRGGGRVWQRPSPQREPRPRPRSAPHLGSVPCRGRGCGQGSAPALLGVWVLVRSSPGHEEAPAFEVPGLGVSLCPAGSCAQVCSALYWAFD